MRDLKHVVHFDFHTQKDVYDVGADFDAEKFAETLKDCNVGYINFFARCNRGFSYYPTKIGIRHPSLDRDILGSVIRECHKRDIGVTAYVNAGLSQAVADAHKEWTQSRTQDGSPDTAAMCYYTAYADHLEAEVREILEMYPDVDGLFIDCIDIQAPCFQSECIDKMKAEGCDPDDRIQLREFDTAKKIRLARRIRDAVPRDKYFFVNGVKEMLDDKCYTDDINTHREIEVVTGVGLGYDCFPVLLARYRHEYEKVLFMSVRFCFDWGDFGAIRPEAAFLHDAYTALAAGGQLEVGDHLHPRGELDKELFKYVKKAFAATLSVEKWTDGARPVYEAGVFRTLQSRGNGFIDNLVMYSGAIRMLEELKYSAEIVDRKMELSKYSFILIPDEILLDNDDKTVLSDYLANGGCILSTGFSGLDRDKTKFMLDEYPYTYLGDEDNDYTYFRMLDGAATLRIYRKGIKMSAGAGEMTGEFIPSYNMTRRYDFNYIPYDKPDPSRAAVARTANTAHIAFRIFDEYQKRGYHAYKYLVKDIIEGFAKDRLIIADLPTFARVALTQNEAYTLLHIISACHEKHGGSAVIEEFVPLYEKSFSIKLNRTVRKLYTIPDKAPIPFVLENGRVNFTLSVPDGHAIVVME